MTDKKTYDCIMIGAGPAALAAAVYTTRESISTLLIEKGAIGGLAATTDFIENYPGFPEGIDGLELADKFRTQAEKFGAVFELGEVQSIAGNGKTKSVTTESGVFEAKSILIATGTDYRKLGLPQDAELYGRGFHYCATCDGAFYRDKHLIVVGSGNSAAQEALFLTRYASKIDLLVRGPKLKSSEILVKRVQDNPKITVHLNTPVQDVVIEDNKLTKVIGANNQTNEKVEFPTDGVFIFIGLIPNTGFLRSSGIEIDEFGFIKTNQHLETNIAGIFAAGDVRQSANMQVVSAAGEGAEAAKMIREYLDSL